MPVILGLSGADSLSLRAGLFSASDFSWARHAASTAWFRLAGSDSRFQRSLAFGYCCVRGLTRLAYRQQWGREFLRYLKRLEAKKPVVFCGDLNVAHTELDLTHPKANVGTHGFTPEERTGFKAFLEAGFIDTFREFEKCGGHYTWWSPMAGARKRNIGWRIDYLLISAALRPRLKRAFIRSDVPGSDHCPVGIELE